MFQSTRPARDATEQSVSITGGNEFQSTRPARDATELAAHFHPYKGFQSTRPARDATQDFVIHEEPLKVSIHAPRAGRDPRSASKLPR